MTRNELKQIYYLNKEAKMWQDELDRLQCQSLAKGQALTGMPSARGVTDKVGNLASEIADVKKVIEGKLAEIQLQRNRIIEFIGQQDDSLMRQIIFYRCVSCMNWNEVAESIGNCTSESVRKYYSRCFEGERNAEYEE
jgi:hypothetical protein